MSETEKELILIHIDIQRALIYAMGLQAWNMAHPGREYDQESFDGLVQDLQPIDIKTRLSEAELRDKSKKQEPIKDGKWPFINGKVQSDV